MCHPSSVSVGNVGEPRGDPEALSRGPYLVAVVDETLRMRPINTETQHELATTWKLRDWELPPHMTIGVSQVLLHFDERQRERPHEFEPERFMGQHPSPFVYSPFGGGTRRCLGATFAPFEASIVQGTLLRELDFEMLDEHVEWGRGKLILEPIGGIRMLAPACQRAGVGELSVPSARPGPRAVRASLHGGSASITNRSSTPSSA